MMRNKFFISFCLLTVVTVASASTCPVLTSMAAPSGYRASSSNASCTLTGALNFSFTEAIIPVSTPSPMTCKYTATSSSTPDALCTLYYDSLASEQAASSSNGVNYWVYQNWGNQVCTSANSSDCTFTEKGFSAVTTCPIFTSSNYSANKVTNFVGFRHTRNSCNSDSLPVFSSAMTNGSSARLSCNYIVDNDLCTFAYNSIAMVTPVGDYWVSNGSVCAESASDCVASP